MTELAIPNDRAKWSFTDIWKKHGAAIITALCLLFILLAWWAGKQNMPTAEIILFVLAYVIGGHQKAIEGLTTLFKERDLDVDLLMVVAAIGAAAIGYWMDGAILIFIFSLSGTLEDYTMEKTNKDIKSIMKLRPEEAVLLENGVERKIKVEALKKGDVILVRPGERISADGIIVEGYSAINEASITGEGIPADKKKGDEVFSGTINGQGALEIEVTKRAEETIISKIIHLVQEAQNEKPPSQLFVERFEGIYAKVVVTAAVLLMTLPPYLFNWTWNDTIYRAMIFLVVASPCALVSSIMPAILSGISNAARKGVLFKGGIHLENIGGVKVVAFDKTGTLTFGKPKVIDVVPFSGMNERELLQIAASVETLSEHPIAKAIVREANDKQLTLSRPKELQAIHGLGVHGILNGKEYKIGKKDIDAPALAIASVGIAMGSGGTDVAMETADIILMSDNIENIPFAINLGRRASRVIKQNIVFAIVVALTLITLNFIGQGQITLPQGVVGHEGSTVLVILSGLRLLR